MQHITFYILCHLIVDTKLHKLHYVKRLAVKTKSNYAAAHLQSGLTSKPKSNHTTPVPRILSQKLPSGRCQHTRY